MSEALKPCPFCGGTNLDPAFSRGYEAGDTNKAVMSAGCFDCSTTGPDVPYDPILSPEKGYADSIIAWNTRAALSDTGEDAKEYPWNKLCAEHSRFPCRICGTTHFDGCRCSSCRPDPTAAVVGSMVVAPELPEPLESVWVEGSDGKHLATPHDALYTFTQAMGFAKKCVAHETQLLQSRIDQLDESETELIKDRDYWEEKATDLANSVGEYFQVDVGEHSSANCPIEEAHKILDGEYVSPRIADLERQLSEARAEVKKAGVMAIAALKEKVSAWREESDAKDRTYDANQYENCLSVISAFEAARLQEEG